MKQVLRDIEKHLRAALAIIGQERKRQNAFATHRKMKQRGTKQGRPKVRDDDAIKLRRAMGQSIRAIAKAEGVSTTAVQRGLKS